MSEFGTAAFNERWRKDGFFPAVDQIPPVAKGSPREFRRLNARILRENIARLRKDLARAEAALVRIEQNASPGSVGAKIDQARLEQNIVALSGWVITAVAGLQTFTYYLSQPGLDKVRRMLRDHTNFDGHASRTP